MTGIDPSVIYMNDVYGNPPGHSGLSQVPLCNSAKLTVHVPAGFTTLVRLSRLVALLSGALLQI